MEFDAFVYHIRDVTCHLKSEERMSAAGNLAFSLSLEAGEYTEAAAIQSKVLVVAKRIWGLHHPNTLDAMGNLAGITAKQGDHVTAAEIECVTQIPQSHCRVSSPQYFCEMGETSSKRTGSHETSYLCL
jgi:hypothetical protein